ncbi:sensor domain-containing diguanylate cyclase [Pseudoduganella buxea]|uniref:Diguanylate cyclase n=1 Tax=Pseudoduganella buxea TaxID=1949069 RepID=A0ABQ1KWL7_9BURK|nr:sensor domain-containing diguanylate cyclase [Pseudoduganella buxea]GGC13343.1 hypothetical protein GCM10011572_38410 [Pseudoduganella buxea]
MFNLATHTGGQAGRHGGSGPAWLQMVLPGLLVCCTLLALLYGGAAAWLALAPVPGSRALALAAAGILGGGALTSGGLAWVLWRNTLLPLRRLAASVDGAGDPAPPIGAGHAWPRELAVLAERFAGMQAEQARANAQLRLAASVFEATAEGILIVSAGLRILEANRAFQRMSGYTRAELVGASPAILHSGRQDAQFYAAMWQGLRTDGHWRGQIWDRRRDGSLFAALLTISTVPAADGSLDHYVALFADITDLRRRQDEVERLAYFDPLTGVANRRLLHERLDAAVREAAVVGGTAAVCSIDLDAFKAVNDERGHDAGDAVLVAVAQRLTAAVRACDTVVRTGGDEFVIVLKGLVDEAEAHDIMRRALAALKEPVALPGTSVVVDASIGLACYPRDGLDGEALLRGSDRAMYRAKRLGRHRVAAGGGAGPC